MELISKKVNYKIREQRKKEMKVKMYISESTRKAYTEVDNFIELLDEYHKNKIPKKLREFFKNEKEEKYIKNIYRNIPIKEQNLLQETLSLIAFLNLQYWCDDEEEKKRLRKIYTENEKTSMKQMGIKYDINNIFKERRKEVIEEETKDNVAMIRYKDSLIQRIINKIKKIFS